MVKCEEGEIGIQIKVSVPSEKEYNSWLADLEKIEMNDIKKQELNESDA